MKKLFKDNLKKITALLLVLSMTMSYNSLAFAQEDSTEDIILQGEQIVEEDSLEKESTNENIEDTSESIYFTNYSTDEEARQGECMPSSPYYIMNFLTYLSIKYPDIGIVPKFGTNGDPSIADKTDELYYNYNAAKMKRQKKYEKIEIDGNDVFNGYSDLTKNMVQFKYLGNFGEYIGTDESGNAVYSDTVKTLIIRNVNEIRNLYVPASVENLIIENTTFNCYSYPSDSPGFQSGMFPGDLKHCKNLKQLVLRNVKFGDNYKNQELKVYEWGSCDYETNYRLNLQNCYNLEELEIDVSFDGASEVQLVIDGGTENQFSKLTDDKCKINPAPGTGYGQVTLYSNPDSYLAKRYNSSESVEFKSGQFRIWLLEALGVDSNHDGVISQDELDAIETLTLNNQTAHSIAQSSLSCFTELTDIKQMHGLKTLEIDFYEPDNSGSDKRKHLKGIDFPASLENLSMKNVYWEKDTQTKSHDNADIILTNLKTLELYNTDVEVKKDDSSYFDHSTRIELTDTEGVLQSCIIERTDVESIKLVNNSMGAGIKAQDEKQRIRFSASDCPNLKTIEFLGEGYAVEGSLDLTGDKELTHIGVPKSADDKTEWTIYGEFDSTYAPINVILNNCSNLGSDCNAIFIDYDFINGRNLNVQAMNTSFDEGRQLIIKRQPRLLDDKAGIVYISCDTDTGNKWIYNKYNGVAGFVIEERTSFPTIAVFANGQRIRTSGEGNHNSDSKYTEESDRWVERWNLVMQPRGYSNDFGNLTFYVVDKVEDENGYTVESLRKVFYKDDIYVEWNEQNDADPIITLPTEIDSITGGYKLKGFKLSSTGMPGEVELKLYVFEKNVDGTIKKNADGSNAKSYIGYQNIKVFHMPDSIELVNDGTKRGSGTKDDPYIIDKKSNEELKLKARLLVDDKVDKSGDYALRDIYWRIKEYDETPKYTSDKDGYSLYTLDTATKAGISVIRGSLNSEETDFQYDRRVDNKSVDGQEPTYYNHRRFTFDTVGSKFKIVAQSPYKNYEKNKDGEVITSEVYVEIYDKPISIAISNDKKLIHGKNGWDETTITINNVEDVDVLDVSINNQELYEDCFTVTRDSSSTDSKEVWKLKINSSDNSKVKKIINSHNSIKLVIKADDKKIERVISLSSVFPDTEEFWCAEIEDQIYTGKAIKPKLNIYNGKFNLVEGKDYTLSYGNNVKLASKNATNKQGKKIGPYVTINGKGNYSNKQTYYFSIVPRSIESIAKVDDIIVAKTGRDIKITPIVTLDGKRLVQGTDYVVSTTVSEADAIISLREAQDIFLYVVGKGNYTGAIRFRFTITDSVLASKVSIQKIANQTYKDGAEIKPDIKISYNRKDVTDCFDIKFENNIEIGTATVLVASKKNYDGKDFIGEAGYCFKGTNKATFKIDGLKITDTKLGINGKDKMPEFIYSGNRHKPTINLYNKAGTEQLEEGKDYTITYSNNINAGTATALVTGKGKYTGTKKFTYKINKYDAGKDEAKVITINNGKAISVSYEKGGVAPKPTISMNGVVLTEKKDYTINYTNNKSVAKADAVNTAGKSIAPTLVVTFKGNLSGKQSLNFAITNKNIAECKTVIADKEYNTRANAWKQTAATIVDTNGNKLVAGTDYNKLFEYYSNPECTNAIVDGELSADTTIYVKITGIKNYEGSYLVGSYRISKTNISTVAATIDDKFDNSYTGSAICPSAEDILVSFGPKKITLTAGQDYEVVSGSYTNNINTGTASVTIRGIGDYYGSKVVKYKICVNKIEWWNW